jgi:hypothetical protein
LFMCKNKNSEFNLCPSAAGGGRVGKLFS